MRNSCLVRFTVGMAALLCGSIAHAQYLPPVIEVEDMTRTVEAVAAPEGVFNFDEETTLEGGPFVKNLMVSEVGAEGTQTTASADQDTDISTFSIRGTGKVDAASEVDPDGFSDTSAASGIEMWFTVRADTEFFLRGTLDSSVDSGTIAFARLNLLATDADGEPIVVVEMSSSPPSEGEVDFIVFDTFKAGTEIYLEVRAYVLNLSTGQGDIHGYASFDVELDLGDRDGDGLLDAWEDDGIDFDNDDIPEIDLPSLGSDPDHKDIFVEVDVMAGVSFDAAIIPMLEEAFGDAPQEHIANPDGLEGINLHVIWDDGDAPTTADGDANIVNFNELYAIKEEKFGS